MTTCSDQNTNSSWAIQSLLLYNKAIKDDFRQQFYEFLILMIIILLVKCIIWWPLIIFISPCKHDNSNCCDPNIKYICRKSS